MNKLELDYLEKPKSQLMHVIYELIRNKAGLVSLIFLFIMIVCSILAPILSPYDPLEINAYNTLKAPDSTHYFGTDATGKNIYSRVFWGGPVCFPQGLYALTHPSSLLKFIYLLHLTTKPAHSNSSVT